MQIFIDGENFRHQIAHVLHFHNHLSDKNHYFPFDWTGFLHEALHVDQADSTYYTTKIKQPINPVPPKMQGKIDDISEANRRQLADLTNQGVSVVKAGYLRVHESNACVHCGKRTLVLQEKGVDVRLAIDLVLAGQDGVQDLVLVSSDSDMSPALSALRQTGAPVTYLCYAGWLNRAVAAGANKTITFDDDLVLKYYRGN
jgi:uncharacterized LabA/DUF88 family protein